MEHGGSSIGKVVTDTRGGGVLSSGARKEGATNGPWSEDSRRRWAFRRRIDDGSESLENERAGKIQLRWIAPRHEHFT